MNQEVTRKTLKETIDWKKKLKMWGQFDVYPSDAPKYDKKGSVEPHKFWFDNQNRILKF